MNNIFHLFCKYSIIFVILLSTGFLLSCKSRSIKTKPNNGNWKKCPVCSGYGTIEIYILDEQNIEKRDKDSDELAACCLYIFFSGTDEAQRYEKHVEEQKLEGSYQDPYNDNRPLKTKFVKCNYCNGVGWILKISD